MYLKGLIYPLIIFMIGATTMYSQDCQDDEKSCALVFHTDNHAHEFTWFLLNLEGDTLGQGDGIDYEDQTDYNFPFCFPEDDCMQLILKDQFNDGFTNGGYFKFVVEGDTLFTLTNYGTTFNHYFNCPPGTTCDDPSNIVEGETQTQNVDEWWYTFEVENTGIYEISTCDNFETCDTRLWLYEGCPTFFSETLEGAIAFNDVNDDCGERAKISVSLSKNTEYLVRARRDELSCGNEIQINASFVGEIFGCTDPESCNYDPMATVDDCSCIDFDHPDCTLGPDLRLNPFALESTMIVDVINNSDECLIEEGCINGVGNRDVISFTTRIENIGELDYYIGEREADLGQYTWDNCHGHFHYDGYAEYNFYDETGQFIPIGFKTGFCVLDLECPSTIQGKFSCDNMGITSGCADVYNNNVQCQWLDITDIPDGDYTFVAKINTDFAPDALGRVEKDSSNNVAHVCINMDRSSGTLVIETSLDCEPYFDCEGTLYGSALEDCLGECGGSAIRGDRNNNQLRDAMDVQVYVEDILYNEDATECSDLFKDGVIDVFDARLLQSCLEFGDVHEHSTGTTAHNHCFFPGGIYNHIDSMEIDMTYDPDWDPGFLNINISNPLDNLSAFQFEITGADIDEVYQNTGGSDLLWNIEHDPISNKIVALPIEGASLERSTTEQGLLRLKVNPIDTAICFAAEPILVSDTDQKQRIFVKNSCQLTGLSSVNTVVDDISLEVFPNPSNSIINVSINNEYFELRNISLYSITGEKVFTADTTTKRNKISVKDWEDGMYFLVVSGIETQYTQKVIVQNAK